MKKLLYSIPLMLILSACGTSTTSGKESDIATATETASDTGVKKSENTADASVKIVLTYPRNLFHKQDADDILGSPTILKDSSYTASIENTKYQCSYATGTPNDSSSIHFDIAEYTQPASAHDAFAKVKSTHDSKLVRPLQGIGDEGYMIVDNKMPWVVVIRKGKRMFKLKVEKIGMSTSIIKYTSVSKRIAESI